MGSLSPAEVDAPVQAAVTSFIALRCYLLHVDTMSRPDHCKKSVRNELRYCSRRKLLKLASIYPAHIHTKSMYVEKL